MGVFKMSKLSSKINLEGGRTILCIDMYNMMFRNLHVAHKNNPTDLEFIDWKYMIINTIHKYIKQFQPNKVVFAFDDRGYWRKDIYPEYKSHRKKDRDKSAIDYDIFFPIAEKFWDDLKNIFKNVYFVRIDRTEADDIIAISTKEVFKDDNLIAISTDKDMHQLLKFKRYRQYNPIQNKFVESLNPIKNLQIKLIMGDSGDNIPSIKPRTGIVTATNMLNDGLDELFEKNEEIKENYERNKRLIDFDCIPKDIINKIKKSFDEYELSNFSGRDYYNFLLNNKLGGLVNVVQEHNLVFSKVG
jgi:5'-3' exonuclease